MWESTTSGLAANGTRPTSDVYNANNQMTTASYDAAGNQTTIPNLSGATQTYDAENRITQVTGSGTTTYGYDGEGRRVQKTGSSSTVYVYDALGRLAADYVSSSIASSCLTCYLSSDHLGSTRLVTDSGANVIGRHDFTSFGEEIPANTAGRNSQWGPFNDVVNQKFTGQLRDAESGFDYFGARYYGSALGRFTSPDWSANQDPIPYGDLENPQTLNLYSYVTNNPLSFKDATGHYHCDPDTATWGESGVTVKEGACHFDLSDFPQLAMAWGHHFIPKQVWQEVDRTTNAWRVLNKTTTGALKNYKVSNRFDTLHRALNRQVDRLLRNLERDLGKSVEDFERGDFEELGKRLEAAGEDVQAFNDRLAALEPEAKSFSQALADALEEVFPAAAEAGAATAEAAGAAAEGVAETGAIP